MNKLGIVCFCLCLFDMFCFFMMIFEITFFLRTREKKKNKKNKQTKQS